MPNGQKPTRGAGFAKLAMVVTVAAAGAAVAHAGNQPICPFSLGWNGTLQTWVSTAPWIKVLWKGNIASAKSLGCKVFWRPYEIPGHDDGDCPSGAAQGASVLSLLSSISRSSWPDAIGFRNEFDGTPSTSVEFLAYYDTLRAGGYNGIIVYGSFGPGGPDMSEWGWPEVQAAIAKADAIETHEYFDLTIKYYDSWTSHRHVRAMNQYSYLRGKPWFIGEFGSDACPFQDREDPCLRRGWRDTKNCGQPKLTESQYITQVGIYRAGDPGNNILAVADNVVAVFMFGQGSGDWWDFEVLNTSVADYLATTWTRTNGSISGSVKDGNNQPVAGATVRTDLGQHAGPGPYTTTTDPNGNYTLSNVAPWSYTVIGSSSGLQALAKFPVSVLYATSTTCNFVLQPAGSLSGHVRDSNSAPVAGATVSTNAGGYSTLSGADGSYSLTNVVAGTYSVTASKTAYASQTKSGITIIGSQTTTCDFSLLEVGINLAPSAVTYLECGHANSTEVGLYAQDGNAVSTKWCCVHNGSNMPGDHWLAYDLGSNAKVTQYLVKNVSLMGEPAGSVGTWDTKAFVVESGSSLRGPWVQEFAVANNTEATWTQIYTTPKNLRYVRLRVTQPTQNNSNWAARIPEFEVWGDAGKSLPVQFEAEDYDSGADADEGTDYHDTTAGNSGGAYRTQDVDIETCSEGGYDVCNIAAGEWLKYRFRGGGQFRMSVRYAATAIGSCHLEVDGTNVTGSVSLPVTGGGQIWQTARTPFFTLGNGDHALKLVNDSAGYALNYFTLSPVVPVPADFDGDGDVDMEDFGYFQLCLTGPGEVQNDPACSHARLDVDLDVDQDDLDLFMRCLTGPDIPADFDCANQP